MRDPETGQVVRADVFDCQLCAFAVREYVVLATETAERRRDQWLPVIYKWLEFAATHYHGAEDRELVDAVSVARFAVEVEVIAPDVTDDDRCATDRALDEMFIARGLEPLFFVDEPLDGDRVRRLEENAPSPAVRSTGLDDFDRNLETTGGAAWTRPS